MSILSEAIQKPQQLALRKMLFQVHLWTGIGVGLYILLISVTGAAIVFQEEMEHAIYSELTHASNVAGPQAAIGTVIENARSAYRGYHVESVFLPRKMSRRSESKCGPTICAWSRMRIRSRRRSWAIGSGIDRFSKS
ncbi:MAG: PepSY-associated TM helix domain-containing protein [Acidobacteriota bacterium]